MGWWWKGGHFANENNCGLSRMLFKEVASVSCKESLDSDRWLSSWCRSYPSQSHSTMFAVEFIGVWPHLCQDPLMQTKGNNTVDSFADAVVIKLNQATIWAIM